MKFKTTFAIAALSALIGFSASAKGLNGNVIVRVNNSTGAAEQMVTGQKISSQAEAVQIAKGGDFAPVDVAVSELDREQGVSSFYFYCPGCYNGGYNYGYTPQYYYYGVSYQPYYQYQYTNYSYYYYGRSYYRYNNWWY